MKKQLIITGLAAGLSTWLLFGQPTGINLALFALIGIVVIKLSLPDTTRHIRWYIQAAIPLIASVMIIIHHSILAHFVYFISCIVLLTRSIDPETGQFFSLFHTPLAWGARHIRWIERKLFDVRTEDIPQEQQQGKSPSKKLWLAPLLTSIPVLIIFFFLYFGASPLFRDLLKNIDLSWIQFPRLLFFGLMLYIFAMIHPFKPIFSWLQFERQLRLDEISPLPMQNVNFQKYLLWIVFGFMNVLLLLINGMDLFYLYIDNKMPEGISLADFVHQGVWGLVAAIALGVMLIGFLYRPHHGDLQKMPWIRRLLQLWVLQNLLMVSSTMVRNSWYITEYQLTYLRIGVFVFLLLAAIGLIHLFFRLGKHRMLYTLLHFNSEVWFYGLALSCLINWDVQIARYNLSHRSTYEPDYYYLLSLSPDVLPMLWNEYQKHPEHWDNYELSLFRYSMRNLKQDCRYHGWQGWHLQRERLRPISHYTPQFQKR